VFFLISAFTDEDIFAQASTFFADGFETSSGAMAFGLYCLAVNPDVQVKVRDEVDSVLKKHDGQLTFDAIQEMTYLDKTLSGKIIFALFKSCFQF
jgi:cytochrome P450 family 6